MNYYIRGHFLLLSKENASFELETKPSSLQHLYTGLLSRQAFFEKVQ